MMLILATKNLTRVTSTLKNQGEKFWEIGRIVKGRAAVNYVRE
jgi:phosphoribosylaminoimidazole (AIR) synthetase